MELTFTAGPGDAGAKLEHFLRGRGISLSLIRALKYEALGLMLNGGRTRSNVRLAPGDVVGLTLPPAPAYSARPEAGPLQVVYESRDAMVVDKPAGMVVHPSASHHGGTLANRWCGLMEQRGQRAQFRPIGRLDGDTSGLVLCAMHAAAAPRLAGTAQKAYLALAGGRLPPGRGEIDAALLKSEDSAIRQQVDDGGKASVTAYEVLAACPEASLVAVWPYTGRTHQIRVHFASIGHPLLGDALYGGDMGLMDRQALHCGALRFAKALYAPRGLPVEAWEALYAPLPPDMAGALDTLLPGQRGAAGPGRLALWPEYGEKTMVIP